MRSKISSTKALIFGLCFLLSYLILTNASNTKENLDKAMQALQKGNDAMLKAQKFIEKANPGKLFAKLGSVLGALGPAMMAVSAILSIAAVFFPQEEESPELKAIKAGFDKVNRRLDTITSGIKDLKNIVELSGAKSAYAKSVTAIQNTYEAYEEAQKEKSKESYMYFVKIYESSFDLATNNLYDAMTGKLGPFGFNIVTLYKDHVKCNPSLVSQFCTMGIQMIVKGLAVEGGYYGALNLSAKAEAKKELWEANMKILIDSCAATINRCEQDWKTTSAQQFRESYNKDMSSDNQDFADKIAKALEEVVPQRSWLAVAYDDASGFGEHTFSSYYEADKIWHEHSHTVTIFSTEVEEPITGAALDEIKATVDKQKSKAAAINDCDTTEFWLLPKKRYGGNDSRTIVNIIRETFQRGVVYSIRNDKNPGVAITGNTLYDSEQKWQCTSETYRLLIFI